MRWKLGDTGEGVGWGGPSSGGASFEHRIQFFLSVATNTVILGRLPWPQFPHL